MKISVGHGHCHSRQHCIKHRWRKAKSTVCCCVVAYSWNGSGQEIAVTNLWESALCNSSIWIWTQLLGLFFISHFAVDLPAHFSLPSALTSFYMYNNLDTGDSEWKRRKKNFSCEFCGKTFAVRRDCLGHVNAVHLKQKPFVCDICNSSFANMKTLHGHRKRCTSQLAETVVKQS